MNYLKLFLILLISNQVFAQPEITNDSIVLNGKSHYFTLMSYGQHSRTKPMKVFTCNKKYFQKIKDNIQKTYKKYKIDYTDFYIISINKEDDKYFENKLLKKYLSKIDEIRISKNLATIQIPFKEYYDKVEKKLKIDYEETAITPLNKIENLHQNIAPKDVCYIMSGRK